MLELPPLDYGIIAAFFCVITLVGLAMSRRASKNLENYFLGGRNLPWYMLGISGMSNWFDLTGTMIITSFLFLLGPRGLYIEFRGGAVLVLAFLMAYGGKWHRRSGCMTPAEWNTFRFGTGFSAELLRFISAMVGIVTTVGTLAYLVRGATLFMGMVFPVDPVLMTIGVLSLAALYTVLAGFYGVVLTDLVQGCIMICGCVVISLVAWHRVPDAATLNALAERVTGNPSWVYSAPAWHVTVPAGYEAYRCLMTAAIFYLLRNVFGGMAGGAEPRFFAARNPREASLQCLLQGLTVMFRWPLMISFAILGIYFVSHIMPDAAVGHQAAAIVHNLAPDVTASQWHGYTSRIVHHPESAPAGMVAELTKTLGPSWKSILLLISPRGTTDPEMILPAVLMASIRPGLRGLLIVSLLSALMGALTCLVNGASALFVRDIYQNFLRPKAGNRELISQAHISSVLIIAISFGLGLAAPNINDIWSWLIMGLTAGALGPGLLRLYWWRTNAWGMSAGLFLGGAAAIAQRLCWPGMPEWLQFVSMGGISFGATVLGSLWSAPAPAEAVHRFYGLTRPFGVWGPYWDALPAADQRSWSREHRAEMLSAASALLWQICLFLLPMEVITHNTDGLLSTGPLFLAGCIGLYVFWWRHLPPATEKVADFSSTAPEQAVEFEGAIPMPVAPEV
jgi:Na+/proline symporter